MKFDTNKCSSHIRISDDGSAATKVEDGEYMWRTVQSAEEIGEKVTVEIVAKSGLVDIGLAEHAESFEFGVCDDPKPYWVLSSNGYKYSLVDGSFKREPYLNL